MLVVSVPPEHASALRQALGDAGAGTWGKYSHCSFTYSGTGCFVPLPGAHPAYGKVGELTQVPEERIEFLCDESKMPAIIAALRKTHPYEEPAFHYFPINIQ
jgi:hypothetical protein